MRKLMAAVVVVGLSGIFAVPGFCEQAAKGPEALFAKTCGRCHPVERPKSKQKTAEEWAATVARMRMNGAQLTDEEAKTVVDYLAKTYGK